MEIQKFVLMCDFVNRVLLMMWDEIGEFAYEHVKPNHFICVSGCLATYVVGERELCYKV